MKPSIIIADDHPLILKGLEDFLEENEYNVIASAKNGKEAFALIKAHQPDLAILDIQMPFLTGLEVAKKCKTETLQTKVILITLEKDEKTYNDAINLGVNGYILKEFALEEIENCIDAVINNSNYFSSDLIAHLETNKEPTNLSKLTNHEREILKLIAQNMIASEIAEEFGISRRTIEKHKSNIIRKLGIDGKQNRLLIWAKENAEFL
ncbi:MAG: response regulator transcription factor [Winogradskyella sp.]|uniref:response regulator transcription factor n=1 Tax=Winogradskyella sp. TaxID=1883156 RepID=UPI0025CFA966|nr:response regulator transcription factor [Winogradskyella sp.]NRB59857.1 response regulator transcription factor [Winogradskyella sp.]